MNQENPLSVRGVILKKYTKALKLANRASQRAENLSVVAKVEGALARQNPSAVDEVADAVAPPELDTELAASHHIRRSNKLAKYADNLFRLGHPKDIPPNS